MFLKIVGLVYSKKLKLKKNLIIKNKVKFTKINFKLICIISKLYFFFYKTKNVPNNFNVPVLGLFLLNLWVYSSRDLVTDKLIDNFYNYFKVSCLYY